MLSTVFSWQSNGQWKCLQSILLAESLPTEDFHKGSADVSAFSSFMREYLDPDVKTDQCAHYVDDIGIASRVLRISRGALGQSPNAYAKQEWEWQ